MKKITTYKANDDELFESEEECLAHEKEIQKYKDIVSVIKEAATICKGYRECEDCPLSAYFPGVCPIGDIVI